MRIFTSLLLLAASASAATPARGRPGHKCLVSGDESAINTALASGGRGATVLLCPGSVHRLASPVRFTAPEQTLTTAGKATGHDRALLTVEGADMATAIFADCKQCGQATISNLAIDGNRPQLLRVPNGGALIEIGNAEGQRVTGCRLYEPRGWSALHVREGDSLNCRQSYIADNTIGPCGEEWDTDYDGFIEKSPPWGNPRADGISVACKDSLVERNVVFDTTDGAIVLFGSAGTEVRDNDIYSRTRIVLGGVNLVDYDPWAGDYTGVKVHHNRLHALGRYFKVGIVLGPSSWSDDTETTVHGAEVSDNVFDGEHFGYAIVVASSSEMTVVRNTVTEDSQFTGVPGYDCPTAPENGKPTAFLINRGSAQGTYQEDFVNGEVQHIICVLPPDANGRPYRPWRMRDSPASIAAADAEEREGAVELEGRLADALVGYQHTLMAAMGAVEKRLDNGSVALKKAGATSAPAAKTPQKAYKADTPRGQPVGNAGPASGVVGARLAALEAFGATLHGDVQGMSLQLDTLATRIRASAEDNRPVIQEVYNRLVAARKDAKDAKTDRSSPPAKAKANVKSKGKSKSKSSTRKRKSTSDGDHASERADTSLAADTGRGIARFISTTSFLLVAGVVAILVVVARRWVRRDRNDKRLP